MPENGEGERRRSSTAAAAAPQSPAEASAIRPVRAAPPPPPPKKKVATAEEAAPPEAAAAPEPPVAETAETSGYDPNAYPGYGSNSEYYQGYGGESYGAVGYDQSQYDYSGQYGQYDAATAGGYAGEYAYQAADGTATYDQSAYSYGEGYDANGQYGQYYQGYDYNATTAADGQQQYDYSAYYDQSAYNAGYDQYGLQTGAVGAEDTDNSTAVSPMPSDAATPSNYDYPAHGHYEYSQYEGYSATAADGSAVSVEVNQEVVVESRPSIADAASTPNVDAEVAEVMEPAIREDAEPRAGQRGSVAESTGKRESIAEGRKSIDERRQSGTAADSRRQSQAATDSRRQSQTVSDSRRQSGAVAEQRRQSQAAGDSRRQSQTATDFRRQSEAKRPSVDAANPFATGDYSQTYDQSATNPFGTEAYGGTAAYGYEQSYGSATDGYAENTNAYGSTEAYGSQPAEAYGAYGTEYNQYGDYSAYGSQDYAQPAAPPPPPPPPVFALPPAAPRTPDPFSWESQTENIAKTGSALPPPRPPPVAKTPEPDDEPKDQLEVEIRSAAPPPRPAAPSPQRPNGPPRPPPPPASPGRSPGAPPPPPPPPQQQKPKEEEEEEDAWSRFNKMSAQISSAVKSTSEQLKNLSENTAANDVKDESYIAQIGGTQFTDLSNAQKQILKMQEEQKKAKADKKARKSASSKKNVVPKFDPKKEEDVERQAAELVARMAASRAHELGDWKPPTETEAKKLPATVEPKAEEPPTPEVEEEEEEEEPAEPPQPEEPQEEEPKPEETPASPERPLPDGWAAFDATFAAKPLPTSDSDFFAASAAKSGPSAADAFGESAEAQADDPFAPTANAFDEDPFDTRPIDEIVAEAKRKAEERERSGEPALIRKASDASTPTEPGTPTAPEAERAMGFEDDFKAAGDYSHTPTPLYDEDDSLPLEDFMPKFAGEGWDLMIRHPIKKKGFMSERCWKPCFVKINETMLQVYNSKTDTTPILEILLQASYSLSDNVLQAYDAYGKIHTVKLQHVLYKERLGIRAGQISRLVEGHITKYGLPLEHAAQINVLAKFASLDSAHFNTFIYAIEDILFKCSTKRDSAPIYKQDEVQIHCYDEYTAKVDKLGNVSQQRARVRMFCLSFLTGSPFLEIGLNDRRREGKEIVRRKDILPMYTERWIRFEGLEFHNTVEQNVWDEDQVIRLQPPDACFFEVMRFRIRPPRNREKPLSVKSMLRMCGSKIELRIDVMAAAHQQRARGTVESTRDIPCEDIQIRFPIPEAWIYIFREERTWGVGSVHSKTRRPGKVKNLKDRLMGAVQHTESTLIEVAIGEAKYEHVYRSLVWRIPRLPEKHHQAYKSHLLKCRFQLSSFDLMPEDFVNECQVEWTMPLATISNTVVRSVSVEQHEDSDRVEKYVRYVAKCHYDQEIDCVQVGNLDDDNDVGLPMNAKTHHTAFNPDEIKAQHEGYGIAVDESKIQTHTNGSADPNTEANPPAGQFNPWDQPGPAPAAAAEGGTFDFDSYARQGNGGVSGYGAGPRRPSSSEEEDADEGKFPRIQIDMSSYGY